MRQTVSVKTQPEARETIPDPAGRGSQSIDAWIEAALAEQAKRALPPTTPDQNPRDAKPEGEQPAWTPRIRPGPMANGIETLMAATVASERRAVETAAKTAVALDSVASWIERAQERLAETSTAASEAQARTASVVHEAIGALEQKLDTIQRKVETTGSPAVSEALKAIERIESRIQEASAERPPAVIEESLRGFEARMKDLSDRLAGPRPIGRRGLGQADDVEQAVAEIRAHQAAIDAGTAGRPELRSSVGGMRGHGGLLSSRVDHPRLAAPAPAAGAPHPALDALKQEIEAMRGSLGDLPRREDLGAIERSIAELASEVVTMRRDGGVDRFEALQAEIRGLATAGSSADHAKLSRDVDVLTHRLDMASVGGIDPQVADTMSAQLSAIRTALTELAGPREIAMLGRQIDDLQREIALVGKGQIDAGDFASLKGTVEEMRDALARPGARSGGPVELARGQLQPIETMLSSLVEKVDRVERHVADPDALDQLERQIAGLNGALGALAGREPTLESLESAMNELMREAATWRQGAVEIAERAARSAVAETLESWTPAVGPNPADDYAQQLEHLRKDLASPTGGAESVQATLESVVQRLGGLERRSEPSATAPIARPAAPIAAAAPIPEPTSERVVPRAAEEAELPTPVTAAPTRARVEPTPAAARAPDAEILLEPGERPQGIPPAGAQPTVDPADIKSSFIAAARRAAQAAADDAAKGKARRPAVASPAAETGTDRAAGIRALIDRYRRPLLIGAAAIALALGGYHLTQETGQRPTLAQAPVRVIPPAPPASSPAPVETARPSTPDPQTTQSVTESAAATSAAPLAPMPVTAAVGPASAPPSGLAKLDATLDAKAPSSTSAAARPDPNGSLAALKQAAAGGNAIALYDLATRTSEGRGAPRDLQLAATYFESAAEKGLAQAQYRTGNLYEKGVGVTRDLDAAKLWYKRAAEQGNMRAMHNLAVLIAEGAGAKPDYDAASAWFQRAAEQGVRDSQYNLAVLYARGLGTKQDFSKSYTWFAIAAAQGDDDAGRKRDEVAAKLSATDLARAKGAAERWRATPSNAAANDGPSSTNWTAEAPAVKRQQRDGRG